MEAFGIATGVVFVAELGDRSQLLTLTFAARYPWRVVLVGIAVSTALLMAMSVVLGTLAGDLLPRRPLEILAGITLLGFAAWTLASGGDEEEAEATRARRSALATVIISFSLAELGDRTMLTTLTLASTNDAIGTWAGATLGTVAASGLALFVGDRLGSRLSPRVLNLAAAATLAAFGVALLIGVG